MARIVALGLAVLVWACAAPGGGDGTGGDVGASDGRLLVYAVNYPLQYFAQRIGGELVQAVLPVPPNRDPALWSPSAEEVGRFQQADLVLLNGAGYAQWVSRANLPRSRLVDTSASFADRLIPLEATITHSHGPEGEHSHLGWAVETWLDPLLALEQARAIADAFSRLRPEHAARFERGLEALETDLLALDGELEEVAARLGDRPLVFSHPAYAYLERRYGLNAVSVHWAPEKEPGHFRMVELEEKLEDHPAEWMIWVSRPIPAAVRRLAERGLRSVVFDPCANAPAEGDYLDAMRSNVEALAEVAGVGTPG